MLLVESASWPVTRAALKACGGLRAQSDYERIASFFGIISDWKDGVPRASYRGVVRPPTSAVSTHLGARSRRVASGIPGMCECGIACF